jgi:hypothetical protein
MMMMTSGSRRALISRHWWNRAPCPHLPEEPNGGLCCASCFPANSKIPGRARPPPAAARLGRSRLSASTRCHRWYPPTPKNSRSAPEGRAVSTPAGHQKIDPLPAAFDHLRPVVRFGSDGPDRQLQPGAPRDGTRKIPAAFDHLRPVVRLGSDRTVPPASFNQVHAGRPSKIPAAFDHLGCARLGRSRLSASTRCTAGRHPQDPGRVRPPPACGSASARTVPTVSFNQMHRWTAQQDPGRVRPPPACGSARIGSDGPACQLQPGAPLDGTRKIPAAFDHLRPRFGFPGKSAGPAAGPFSGILAMVNAAAGS